MSAAKRDAARLALSHAAVSTLLGLRSVYAQMAGPQLCVRAGGELVNEHPGGVMRRLRSKDAGVGRLL
jgi:hypothetical protein